MRSGAAFHVGNGDKTGDEGMTAKTALVIGASSSLAVALCRGLAARGWQLVITGRNQEELALQATDLRVRYAVNVTTHLLDLSDFLPENLVTKAGHVDALFIVAADMGNGNHNDPANIAHCIRINFTAPAQLLTVFAEAMEARGNGTLVVISSVAGDRGRQRNYPYGSAKAGITAFASGLRNRLAGKNVHVMTAKPGFIDTPLTYSMHSRLIASRESVAEAIIKAFEKRRDVIYVPFFWWYIMLIVRNIPEAIFKKLNL